jgi:hypothetical protein
MRLKSISIIICFVGSILLFTGCSHKQVEPSKLTDDRLTCQEIMAEVMEVKMVKQEIESNRGASGRNIALILFWPGIIANELNGKEANDLADKYSLKKFTTESKTTQSNIVRETPKSN